MKEETTTWNQERIEWTLKKRLWLVLPITKWRTLLMGTTVMVVFLFFTKPSVVIYLNCRTYPDSFSKTDKLALQKRAKYFCIKGANLYYVGGFSSKFTALVTESYKNYIHWSLLLSYHYIITDDKNTERLVVRRLVTMSTYCCQSA